MIKCKCGNHYSDCFSREDINEYKCKLCGEITNDDSYIEVYYDTTNDVEMECGCTLEIEE